jgi:two-component system response regulator GlrR
MVARSDASVLLRGDSGTGKELLAQRHPPASPRAGKPFVAVNCGAIPRPARVRTVRPREGRLHRRGGQPQGPVPGGRRRHAAARRNRRHAAGPAGQAAARAAGARGAAAGLQPVDAVDVRIISATHRDLDAAMAAGQFREDLYYRLNVVTLTLPTLASAARTFPCWPTTSCKLAAKYGKRLSGFAPEALKALSGARLAGQRAPAVQRGGAGLRAVDHAAGAAGAGAARAARAQRSRC